MKIGVFAECYKPTINGVVTSIETFRIQLEKRGHQVFIFCPKHKKAEFQPGVYRVPSITLPSPKDYPIGIPHLSNLKSQISNLKLDIIHTHHIFLMGGFGQVMAKMLNTPTVHTYHTLMTEYAHYVPIRFLRGLIKKFIIYRSKKFCNRANKVLVPSSPMIDVLRSYGVKTSIEVLPTGIDLKEFKKLNERWRRTILKKYKIPTNKKLLLYVGRIAKEKNIDFLLECFKDVLVKQPDVHLAFVGSGPYQENLKFQISKLELQENVTTTGFLPKPEIHKIFGAGDIFVFPSITDTQGIVLAEAMASQIPVVAINQLGPKDIVKDGEDGFLVPLNKKEFTDKILRLVENEKLRKSFGQKAQKNIKRFSIEDCTEKLIKVYKKVIHEYTL